MIPTHRKGSAVQSGGASVESSQRNPGCSADREESRRAYDEGLAERIRGVLDERKDVSERRMFGGLAFLVRGHMSVGIVKDRVMVRVGPEVYDRLLEEPHARKMDFTGRPMKGFL